MLNARLLFWPADTRLSNRLLVVMPLLAIAPRCYFILETLQAQHVDIFSTGFGFGDYTRSLLETAQFRSCSSLPFVPCHPQVCTNATRMPVMPVLFAVMAKALGQQAAPVAVAKCVILAVLASLFLRAAVRDMRISATGVAVMYAIYFGLQPLKHGASLAYEEGLLLDFSLCLGVALSYLVRSESFASGARRGGMALAAIVLATAMYFTKTTALLTLAVVLGIVLTHPALTKRLKAIGMLLVCVPFALWMLHTESTSGQVHASSSWNGENLLRGYNSGAARIYPEITLDRAFDTKQAVMLDGTVVPLGDFSDQRCFNDEWAWNDYYAAAARRWIEQHPWMALRFDLTKAWVALVEIRHTPTFLSATDKTPLYSIPTRVVMATWMTGARIVFFVLMFLLLRDLRSKSRPRYYWAFLLVGAACAPYVVVFGWQRHMIPVLVLAATLLVFLYMAEPRAEQPPSNRQA